MKQSTLGDLLDEFISNNSASGTPLVAHVDNLAIEAATRSEKTTIQLQSINDWLRDFFEDERPAIGPALTVEALKTKHRSITRDVEQIEAYLTAVKSLHAIVDSMIRCLQNLRRDLTPLDTLQGYLAARKEMLAATGAEWAVAAEEKVGARAQRLNELFFKTFAAAPLSLLDLLLESDGDVQPVQNFLLAFHTRLISETVEGRGELPQLLAFEQRARNALGPVFGEQLTNASERVLRERGEVLVRLSRSATANVGTFDSFVDCAMELGFSALAASVQTQFRLGEHSEALNRLRAPKELFAAFFTEQALTAEEFVAALVPLIPTGQNVEELLGLSGRERSRVIATEYALAFYRLLRFLLERHLPLARGKIPRGGLVVVIRAAAAGVLDFPMRQRAVLFANFAEMEFRWLRLCS